MRYILFAGAHYHPLGGADDISKVSDDLDRLKTLAKALLVNDLYDWVQIYDTEQEEVIFKDEVQ